MAKIGDSVVTLLDHAKRLDPNGKVARIAELLSESNEIMNDMPFIEGNLATGHLGTMRTGLPTVYWRKLNQGISPSKSTTAQVTEACAILEARSHVDVDLASLNGETGAFRLSEAKAFIESMTQEFVATLFYGSSTAPEEFVGLADRYSDTTANNGDNIISAGGSGSDNSSIWLVGWSSDTIHGIYPKGSKAGLHHKDLGTQLIQTGTNGVDVATMEAYVDKWQMKAGLFLKDWRYAVRIPNIDISNLVGESSAADLTKLMIKAIHRIPNKSKVKLCFYANRSVIQMLDIQRRDNVQDGGGLTFQNEQGEQVMTFRGIPVRLCDQLTEAESVVS
jgi:hypothetical protein